MRPAFTFLALLIILSGCSPPLRKPGPVPFGDGSDDFFNDIGDGLIFTGRVIAAGVIGSALGTEASDRVLGVGKYSPAEIQKRADSVEQKRIDLERKRRLEELQIQALETKKTSDQVIGAKIGPVEDIKQETNGFDAIANIPVSLNVSDIREKAEQGQAAAQSSLAYLYYSGKGVPQDYVEARKWSLKAAEQGHNKGTSLSRRKIFPWSRRTAGL